MRPINAAALLFAFSLCTLLLIRCGERSGKDLDADTTTSDKWNTSLTVAGAASLKNIFDAIGEEFEKKHPEVKITFSYAGSNILARQIQQGAPFDIVALAAEETMNQLDSAHVLLPGSRTIFARNRLCVVIPHHSSLHIEQLSDLLDPSFEHIAIAAPGVPARIYAEEALRNAGLWEKLEPRFVYGANVRQVMSYIESGEVECGFIYKSDANLGRTVGPAFIIDSTLHRPILYPAAVLQNSQAKALAKEFVEWIQSPVGKVLLQKYGFE